MQPLDTLNIHNDPIEQFQRWFEDAKAAQLKLPEAMVLSSATCDGRPSSRVVLLKQVDGHGFTFFTNYNSRKGEELDANANASLLFYWTQLDRQIRIEGSVVRVHVKESEEYFRTRPRGSQLGAHASTQSERIANRDMLEQRYAELEIIYAGMEIPCPPHWGGYRVRPHRIEFWQGRDNRLHDRMVYELQPDGQWKIGRLAP